MNKPNYESGQPVQVLCHNYMHKTDEWRDAKVIDVIPAMDIDYRIEVELNSGTVLLGHAAAHPDCVRPL